MAENPLPTGVVLAGGQSRRMGGGDKGLVNIGDKTMLGCVVERLRPQVGPMVINANGNPRRFQALRLPVVADTIGGFPGPLAGILAGMRWSLLHAPEIRWIVTATSDVPFLPADLVARLFAAVPDRPTAIALAQSQGALHPAIGLWPVVLADDLERNLAAGTRKMLHWTSQHDAVAAPFEPIKMGSHVIDPFFNVNTPADVEIVRSIWESLRE